MNKVLTALIILFSVHVDAQVIDISVSWDGELDISLEPAFIKQKKLACVICEFSTKKPNQQIKPSSDEKQMSFNRDGLISELISKKYISINKIEQHEIYTYSENELAHVIEKDQTGYFCTYYNKSGDTTETSTFRGTHYSPLCTSDKTDSTLINNTSYIGHPNVLKSYNKNGIHIQSKFTIRDSIGLLKEEKLTYELNHHSIHKRYAHNARGLISEIELNTGSIFKNYRLFYDRNDVLQKIEIWKDEVNTKVYEIIYSDSGWLDAMIIQDPKTNNIQITKFRYTLHP